VSRPPAQLTRGPVDPSESPVSPSLPATFGPGAKNPPSLFLSVYNGGVTLGGIAPVVGEREAEERSPGPRLYLREPRPPSPCHSRSRSCPRSRPRLLSVQAPVRLLRPLDRGTRAASAFARGGSAWRRSGRARARLRNAGGPRPIPLEQTSI
jgi:hypothetical protein